MRTAFCFCFPVLFLRADYCKARAVKWGGRKEKGLLTVVASGPSYESKRARIMNEMEKPKKKTWQTCVGNCCLETVYTASSWSIFHFLSSIVEPALGSNAPGTPFCRSWRSGLYKLVKETLCEAMQWCAVRSALQQSPSLGVRGASSQVKYMAGRFFVFLHLPSREVARGNYRPQRQHSKQQERSNSSSRSRSSTAAAATAAQQFWILAISLSAFWAGFIFS